MNKALASAILICSLALTSGGCFVITNKEDVAFLQGLAESQDRMQQHVGQEQARFGKLTLDIKRGRLKKGTPREEIVALYGEPVLCRQSPEDKTQDFCLYRNPRRYFPADFVYLYFDAKQNLTSWKLRPENQ